MNDDPRPMDPKLVEELDAAQHQIEDAEKLEAQRLAVDDAWRVIAQNESLQPALQSLYDAVQPFSPVFRNGSAEQTAFNDGLRCAWLVVHESLARSGIDIYRTMGERK